jgi:hypothetical protein
MLNTIGKVFRQIGNLLRPSELARLDPAEVEQLARDVGITSYDLRRLSTLGPDAADRLYERLKREGVDLQRLKDCEPRALKDMQLTCSCCGEKEHCSDELDSQKRDGNWKSYCPNATTIDYIR